MMASRGGGVRHSGELDRGREPLQSHSRRYLVRVQNALAIATSDRSAQIQAKHTADASRIVRDLYDAASGARVDDFSSQTDADPESSAIAQRWPRPDRQTAPVSRKVDSTPEAGNSTTPRRGISLWA
jgi:hypothetical protein